MKKIVALGLVLGACTAGQEVAIRSANQPGGQGYQQANLGEYANPSAIGNATNIVVKEVQKGYYKVGNPYLIDGVPYYPHEDFAYVEEGIASWYGPGFHGQSTSNGETFDQNLHTAAHRTLPMPSCVRVTNLENGASVYLKVNDRGPFARDRIIDVSSAAADALGMKQKGSAQVRVEILQAESMRAKDLAVAGQPTDDVCPTDAGQVALLGGASQPAMVAALPAPRPEPVAEEPKPEPELPPPPAPQIIEREPMPEPTPVVVAPVPAPAPAPAPTSAGGDLYVQIAAYSTFERAEAMKNKISDLGQVKIFKATQNGQTLYKVRLGEFSSRDSASAAQSSLDKRGITGSRIVIKDGDELRWSSK